MKVKCLGDSGKYISKKTLKLSGNTERMELPLKIGEVYVVYGMEMINGLLEYLIVGTYQDLPWWYTAELFEVVEPTLPLEFFFRYDKDCIIPAMWGYEEMIMDPNHHDDLIDQEIPAVEIFIKRKREIDEYAEFQSL